MPKPRVFACLLLLALIAVSTACAQDRVSCYTMWDDNFLYAAFEVQDPNIASTNTTHMSKPWEDDCIEIFLETDFKRASDRSPQTFQMSVSAGGGSSFLIGENGVATPKTIYSFKYAKAIQGTLNRSRDRDLGYIIEMAMPWREMGGPPAPGQVMGFNVVCRMRGENTGFVSFSPDVVNEEDIQVPALWSKIKFVDTPTIIAQEDGAIVCRKVARRSPLIDGKLGTGEWIRDMRFQIVKPLPPPVRPEEQRFMLEKLSLTHYFYWYQGDERKEATFSHVRYQDGSSALTSHPADSAGPWFSYERVQWHKDQLSEIRNSGIDVIIPVYWGDSGSRQGFASNGLKSMVQAMKELKAEKKGFPPVGMFFDTSAMTSQYAEKPDLTTDEVKETFYGMMKDFFLNVPGEFRAVVQLPQEKGGHPAYVVVLYTASSLGDFDESFVTYCNDRFAEDFGGHKLIWIGASDYREKAAVMDGYSDYGAGLGLKYDDAGWIHVAGIGAGYDDSAVPGRKTPIRARIDGDTYKKDWDELIEKSPHWVIVDGWNELHEGSDICPTMQYGNRYTGLTRINMLRFNGMLPYDAKYLRHDTPSVMLPGMLYQVTLTIKNAGTKPWYPGVGGVGLVARWFKDGVLFADAGLRLPLQEAVLAGNILQKTVGLRTVDADGNPLPEGDYELRWEMVRGRDNLFSDEEDIPLCVPVRIGTPTGGFTLVHSTLPTTLKIGAAYNVTVSFRNDSSTTWKADTARIQGRWFKVSSRLGDVPDEAVELAAMPVDAPLPADVAPGRVVDVVVPVTLLMADGSPMPVSAASDLSTYVLKWDVLDGEHSLALDGIGCASEAVRIVTDDYGPRFVASETPAEMNADRQVRVNVTLQNTGTDIWKKGEFAVGYHWYYLDGTEAVWDGVKTPLPSDVRPGGQVVVRANVTPPAYDGQYYLVWDLAHGEKWVSNTANTRGGDILVVPVQVVKGKLIAQDLSKLFDADVISYDTNRADGDADGAGHTLPAEFLPPLVTASTSDARLWPSGMWSAAGGSGMESSRRISFRYPSKADGAKNALTCKGNTIEVKPGKYSAVHVLAISTEDTVGSFTLGYKDSQVSTSVRLSAWDAAPKNGELPGFVCLHRHSPTEDQRGRACYVNHYEIKTNPSLDLTSIALPDNPAVKILAVTLEVAK